MKNERFEMRAPESLLASVDEWRRRQPDIPNRSEAVRRLIEAGIRVSSADSDPTPIIGTKPKG